MYIIAEIAQAHDGSLGNVLSFIKSAADSNLNAVKLQYHIAEEESTPSEKFRVDIFPQDTSRYSYWKRMEFTQDQWQHISDFADKCGIDLIISPFSQKALDLCSDLKVKAFKIGSGETTNYPLIQSCLNTNKEVIISTGMSSWNEVNDLCSKFSHSYSQIILMHCVSKYPCPLNEVGINNINLLKEKYNLPVGLSDHSGDIDIALHCASLQVAYFEAHICWSREMFGPDTLSSLTIEEFKRLAQYEKKVSLLSHNVDKDIISSNLSSMRFLFRKSLVAAEKLKKGHVIRRSDVKYKKPAGGLSYSNLENIIGMTLINDIEKDSFIDFKDLS